MIDHTDETVLRGIIVKELQNRVYDMVRSGCFEFQTDENYSSVREFVVSTGQDTESLSVVLDDVWSHFASEVVEPILDDLALCFAG